MRFRCKTLPLLRLLPSGCGSCSPMSGDAVGRSALDVEVGSGRTGASAPAQRDILVVQIYTGLIYERQGLVKDAAAAIKASCK